MEKHQNHPIFTIEMSDTNTNCSENEILLEEKVLEKSNEYKAAYNHIKASLGEVAAETYYDLRPSSAIMHKIKLLDPGKKYDEFHIVNWLNLKH